MATHADPGSDLVALVTEPIEIEPLAESVRTDAAGAVALFAGVVRSHHRGRQVDRLEYEAYGPMALQEMHRIAAEIRARWAVEGVAIVHRTGTIEVGETSVAVAVSAVHRREALEACAHAIDLLKESVPLWKKEHAEGGGAWVIGDDASRPPVLRSLPRPGASARRRGEA